MIIMDHSWLDPVETASVFADVIGTQFFHSSATGPAARWSILVMQPERVITDWSELASIAAADPLKAAPLPPSLSSDWPFQGGWAGFIGYDAACAARGVQSRHTPHPRPDLWMGFYNRAVVFDHQERRVGLLAPSQRAALELMDAITNHSRAPVSPQNAAVVPAWSRSPSDNVMQDQVAGLVRAIHAGDVFQANLALTYHRPLYGGDDLFALYSSLAKDNPAPFGGYANYGDLRLASLSPEQFISIDKGWIATRPIKGTRRRDCDPARDHALAHSLAHDPKERAENTMIVDLMRNDLTPYVEDDTLAVPVLCALETHPSVHHLVSEVRGRLRSDVSPLTAWMGMLPGGSITGAPKHQAMLEIDQREERARGPYCGSWGYISQCGRMDTNILIRTLVSYAGTITLSAGAGITALSDPASEVEEMHLKARRLLAMESFRHREEAA